MRKAALLQHMLKSGENSWYVVPVIVLKVVRTIDSIERTSFQTDKIPGIANDIRRSFRIDIKQPMVKSCIFGWQRNLLAVSADVQNLFRCQLLGFSRQDILE
jgi:hypothetical protein